MKNTNFKSILIACAVLSAGMANAQDAPRGWFPAGSRPRDYLMSVDRAVAHGGNASASLRSVVAGPTGFGTLMQTFKAEVYRGKRVRMSGYVRSQGVMNWAGLWMRVDGTHGELLAFDNMEDRAIKGTSDWQKCEIVLDVPESGLEIAFGLLLNGAGQAWMDDLSFEVVGKDVPTTGPKTSTGTPPAPVNLNFEE
jgi:hypothetical protein